MSEIIRIFMYIREFGLYALCFNRPAPLEIMILLLLLCALIAYLLGSINTAIMISRHKYKEDIRNYGSGNGGMTNMMRTYGTGSAALTFCGDLAKALISVIIGCLLMGLWGGYVAGLFCVIGHCFPVYHKFHGGKGVATTAMVILCLSPLTFAILLLFFVILVVGYRYISLASVMCMLLYPVMLPMTDRNGTQFAIVAVLIALLVVFMHRANIKRLLNHTESKFKFKKHGDREQKDEENS